MDKEAEQTNQEMRNKLGDRLLFLVHLTADLRHGSEPTHQQKRWEQEANPRGRLNSEQLPRCCAPLRAGQRVAAASCGAFGMRGMLECSVCGWRVDAEG